MNLLHTIAVYCGKLPKLYTTGGLEKDEEHYKQHLSSGELV
jgi:hypothetical protein